MTTVTTVVVGGGQAGLSVSHYLRQRSVHHVVLEQADKPGEAWRNHRWGSFALSTPRWQSRLPGVRYGVDDPDGFIALGRASALLLMLDGFATYATGIYPTARHNLPHQADSAIAPAGATQSRE